VGRIGRERGVARGRREVGRDGGRDGGGGVDSVEATAELSKTPMISKPAQSFQAG
jgi:hypothetical protein